MQECHSCVKGYLPSEDFWRLQSAFWGLLLEQRHLFQYSALTQNRLCAQTDGPRWHAKAFCRKNQDFRDFVISRMEQTAVLINKPVEKHELQADDIQWNRIVELELIPHPDRKHPEITMKDYGMLDGVLHLKLRAAMAGYVLRQWHVDCSPDHHLDDEAFRLWLRDPLALYGVGSATFAPGYQNPQSNENLSV